MYYQELTPFHQERLTHLTKLLSKVTNQERTKKNTQANYHFATTENHLIYLAKDIIKQQNIADVKLMFDVFTIALPNMLKGVDPLIAFALIEPTNTNLYFYLLGYFEHLKAWYDEQEKDNPFIK